MIKQLPHGIGDHTCTCAALINLGLLDVSACSTATSCRPKRILRAASRVSAQIPAALLRYKCIPCAASRSVHRSLAALGTPACLACSTCLTTSSLGIQMR